ncbi:hypothetical protein V6N12_007411 [Hibiscus sabdariffa]|uniref:Uncharacterized protein n=1 Tax=Hibiscus sabdariffa TaxID=183260 RepID=A0ABR2F1Q0_9ROSI
MFMFPTTAAYDNHKNIILLAFEITEKIVRDNFPYITETETTTSTDCVNFLVAFTNNRFNKDISLNAIVFLRFCAPKLAEGDLSSSSMNKDKESGDTSQSSPNKGNNGRQENGELVDKDDHLYFWLLCWLGIDGDMSKIDQDGWLYETCTLALQLLVDLFFEFLSYHPPTFKEGYLFTLKFYQASSPKPSWYRN